MSTSSSSSSNRKRKADDIIDLTEFSRPFSKIRSSSCISTLSYTDKVKAKPVSYFNHVFSGSAGLLALMASFLSACERARQVLRLSKMYSIHSKSSSFWSNCVFGERDLLERERAMVLTEKIPRHTKNNILYIPSTVVGNVGNYNSPGVRIPKAEADNLCIAYRNLIKRHAESGKKERSFKTVIMFCPKYGGNPAIIWHCSKYVEKLRLAGRMLGTVKTQSVLLFMKHDPILTLQSMFQQRAKGLSFEPTTLGIVTLQLTQGYMSDRIEVTIPSVRTLVVFVIHSESLNIQHVVNNWLRICTNVENVYIYTMHPLGRSDFVGQKHPLGRGDFVGQKQATLNIPEHPTLKNITISARYHVIGLCKAINDNVCLTVYDRFCYERQYTVTGFLSELTNSVYAGMLSEPVQPIRELLNFEQDVQDSFYSHFICRLGFDLFFE